MFGIDSIVRLNSGGPEMAVLAEEDGGLFLCCWLDKKKRYKEAEFPFKVLNELTPALSGFKNHALRPGTVVSFIPSLTDMTVIDSGNRESLCVWFDDDGHKQQGNFRNMTLCERPSWDNDNISKELLVEKPGWNEGY